MLRWAFSFIWFMLTTSWLIEMSQNSWITVSLPLWRNNLERENGCSSILPNRERSLARGPLIQQGWPLRSSPSLLLFRFSLLEILNGSCPLVPSAYVSFPKHPSGWPLLSYPFNRITWDLERKSPSAIWWQIWTWVVRTLLNSTPLLTHSESCCFPSLYMNIFFWTVLKWFAFNWLSVSLSSWPQAHSPSSFS